MGRRKKDYLYSVGDIITTQEGEEIRIVEQIEIKNSRNENQKGYIYECVKESHRNQATESNLKKLKRCAICSGRQVLEGYNDVVTTHPHLVQYFVNKEEAKQYSFGSTKRIKVKCPNCKTEKEVNIYTLAYNGIECVKCGDGASFPSKFILSLIDQNKTLKYETEKTFSWSENRKYDFYIDELNMIIEVHGEQHYNRGFDTCKGRTLQEEQENDRLKERLARENGIEYYIQLDCRDSSLEWIKKSILDSNLLNLLKIEQVDWSKCYSFACSSRVKEASDLWNSGIHSSSKIGEIMHLHRKTINSYLKRGKELGWCDYTNQRGGYHGKK